MTRVFKQQRAVLDHRRARAVEFNGEPGLCVCEVDFRERVGDCGYPAQVSSERLGYFEKDSRDFDLFFFAKPDHLVVLIDDRQRLDERGLTAGRKSVHYARHLSTRIGPHWNHETSIANSDDVFLDG